MNSVCIILLILILVFIYLLNYFFNKKEHYSNINNLDQILEDSKKIPITVINPNKKIAFIYVHTPNIYDYTEHSIKNLKEYIYKYDYTLIIYNNIIYDNVSPCWNKVLAVLINLKNYDYVVWYDADAIINNMDISIESIINKSENKDLLICFDIALQSQCINSGIMIIKNTEWSYNLFKKTWLNPIEHGHNDQNILFHEIIKEVDSHFNPLIPYYPYCKVNIHPKVAIYEQNEFNSNILNFLNNDFIIHLMGVSTKGRIHIMRQINTKLGFDNYDNKECIEVLNKYGNIISSDEKELNIREIGRAHV